MLAEDEDWYVREAVAMNPHTPHNTLVMLSKDADERVSKAAIKALSKGKEKGKTRIER